MPTAPAGRPGAPNRRRRPRRRSAPTIPPPRRTATATPATSIGSYPEDAISRRRGGVAKVDVTLDAGGRVKSASLAAGSGTLSLDREALAMLRRAQPLPAPPPERLVAGQIRIVLPIHFDLNQAG
ncbi:energy transducer TonB family protein [Chromobacterium phragmitis]|uniref:energy transducer TonB family protein n=1 Tax=Chromobacterium phragmitis TaxID=2202141 RepID=UPI003877C9AE